MEESLGAPLLQRHRRGVRATPAGAALVHHARLVIQQLDRMRGELSEYADGFRGRVRVFANTTATAEFLPAALAAFLSQHYGAPVMLMALLLGMAMNFLSAEGACVPGIDFTARTVLRFGVALLGLRITLTQIAALGWQPIALVLISVALTIATAIAAARLLGFRAGFGLLSGGATAICGASAALAIAAAPNH